MLTIERRGNLNYWPDSIQDPTYDAEPAMLAALEAAVHVARHMGVEDTYPALGESDSREMLPRLAAAIRGAVPGLRLCQPEHNYATYGGGTVYGPTSIVRALLHAHAWLGVWGPARHWTFDRLVIHAPEHEPGCADTHSYYGRVTVAPYGPRGGYPEEERVDFDHPDQLRHWMARRGATAAR